MKRCTVAGEGLLKMEGFPETSPLRVEVASCAARVEHLMDASPPPWTPKALAWEGSDNRFDVTGGDWATAGSSETGVATSEDWSRLYPEKSLDETGVRFSMQGQTTDGRLLPTAYSLLGPTGSSYGANPADVGPRP
jgi:hypothetical protein